MIRVTCAVLCPLLACVVLHAEPPALGVTPLVRVVDLNVGESMTVELSDGTNATVRVLDLEDIRDDIRGAVRLSRLKLMVNGERCELEAAPYRLPVTIAGVQIDCPVTQGYVEKSSGDHWGLEKDVRLRLWPAGSPLVRPGSFGYPVKQRWFASLTWMDNEPVDAGDRIRPTIYYHSGVDIGGAEGRVDVIAATDGAVVSRGEQILSGQEDTPISKRADVVYLLDARGWYYRYSHLEEIDPNLKLGASVKQGQRIGSIGKAGASGGWSHLHFEIKSRQPSGKWGTQAGYALIREAYLEHCEQKVFAVARPGNLVRAGEEVSLDGSRSWSADGKIASYEWLFDDGTKVSGARVKRTYTRPGRYSETLRVTDSEGRVDYDFARIIVVAQMQPELYPPYVHLCYYPTSEIQPGDPVTFKVRSFDIENGYGREILDFGDGSPVAILESDGNVRRGGDPHARDGYAVTTHRYRQPGHYVVRVERSNERGETAVCHVQVRVVETTR